MNKITEHFSWAEAACKDGTEVPDKYKPNATKVAKNLEIIRTALGSQSLDINSFYRTVKHNAKQKGSPVSQHLSAKAADFSTRDNTPEQIYAVVEALIFLGLIPDGGLGLYNGFVHYDIGKAGRRWDLRK